MGRVVYMAHVLVIGAGLSGCTVAYTLASHGVDVTIAEKTDSIGGKVRTYGCKAVDGKCQNCGLCLTTGLWNKVLDNKNISLLTNAVVTDITGEPGDYSAKVSQDNNETNYAGIDAVVVSTGFECFPNITSNHLHIKDRTGLITGTQIENLMLSRTQTDIFEKPPQSIAFIQCVGSRDKNEDGLYCSRVCCSYSTRAAKVIRSYYPECEIVFFYMELQNVKSGNYYAELRELGIEFIKCRPLKITGGAPVTVEYDDFTDGIKGGSRKLFSVGSAHNAISDSEHGIKIRDFDLVVLSDGIHAALDNERMAEVYGLGQDKDGFLYAVGKNSGTYVTGCARAPMKIDETYADSVAAAGKILASILEYDAGAAYALYRR